MVANACAPAFINSMVWAMISPVFGSLDTPPSWPCQRSRYCFARYCKSGGFAMPVMILFVSVPL